METTSVWRRYVSTTGRESARGPWPWRLARQTGSRRQTPGKWSTPVWRKASGASTRNSPTVASAPTITSAFSVPQVALMTAAQSCAHYHFADTNIQPCMHVALATGWNKSSYIMPCCDFLSLIIMLALLRMSHSVLRCVFSTELLGRLERMGSLFNHSL